MKEAFRKAGELLGDLQQHSPAAKVSLSYDKLHRTFAYRWDYKEYHAIFEYDYYELEYGNYDFNFILQRIARALTDTIMKQIFGKVI